MLLPVADTVSVTVSVTVCVTGCAHADAVADSDADVGAGSVAAGKEGAGTDALEDGASVWVSTTHICSGVKFGGEQGVLLTKPSWLRVRHVLPGPMPLFTASLTSGNPPVKDPLKKNSWSAVVSPSPAARPPGICIWLSVVPLYHFGFPLTTSEQPRTGTIVLIAPAVYAGKLL